MKPEHAIYRDGVLIEVCGTKLDCMRRLHRISSSSVDWACKYEGYEIKLTTEPVHEYNCFETPCTCRELGES